MGEARKVEPVTFCCAFARNTKAQLKQMFDALRELMATPEPIKRPIGFVHPSEKPSDTKGRRK
ncbi:MAG: hypothetical protein ING75_01900 [Rhodocyclaceae bacterium]|nr:hypothetical protein [Rhodocyclaceae bacterium]